MITPCQLALARSAQLSIMLDRVRLERPSGTTDEGYSTTTTWTTVFTGPGRLQRDRNAATTTLLAAQDVRPAGYVGAVPWNAPTLHRGDRITIIASLDPAMKGRTYVIRDVEVGSTYLTARRYHAEEVVT